MRSGRSTGSHQCDFGDYVGHWVGCGPWDGEDLERRSGVTWGLGGREPGVVLERLPRYEVHPLYEAVEVPEVHQFVVPVEREKDRVSQGDSVDGEGEHPSRPPRPHHSGNDLYAY